jgi:hypothetical protein
MPKKTYSIRITKLRNVPVYRGSAQSALRFLENQHISKSSEEK